MPVEYKMLLVQTANRVLTILISQILFITNFYLLYDVFCSKKIAFQSSLSLFYCRFVVDVMLTLCVTVNKTYFLLTSTSQQYAAKNIAFFAFWPTLTFATMRFSMGFLITFDRLVAVYCPIFYYLHRKKFSIHFVVLTLMLLVLFNHYVLFGYCAYSIDGPLDCYDFKCVLNLCYQSYYFSQEQVIYFIIEVMTVLLCVRLFIRYISAQSEVSKFLSKATRVTLLDSLLILVFNILPSSTFQFAATNLEIFGPLLVLFKLVGALIETFLVFRIFKRDKNIAPNVVSPAI